MSVRGFKRPEGSCKNARTKRQTASRHTERPGNKQATRLLAPLNRQFETFICCERRMLKRQGRYRSVFKNKPKKGTVRKTGISPGVMLTLLSPFCSPCTGGTWAWGWGWSPLPGTFSPPEPPGMGPSLPAAGKTQLQGCADHRSA